MMRLGVLVAALIACLFFASGAKAQGQVDLRAYASLALSSKGDRLAYVETVGPLSGVGLPTHGRILIRDTHGGALIGEYDPCSRCRYSDLTWSPDGRALAYVATDAGKARPEVIRDGKAARLAEVEGDAETPRWSPDGMSLAVLAGKTAGSLEAGAVQVGEIGEAGAGEQRIAVVPFGGGPLRYISRAGVFVYEYDWTPDGKGFVVTAAKGDGDANWWIAKLEAIDLATGAERTIASFPMQISMPRVSSDGRTVNFIGGLMSDFGEIGGDVYAVPLAGGEPLDLTPGYKGSFTSLLERRDGLYATALVGDRMAVVRVAPAGVEVLRAAPTTLTAGETRVTLSADARTAAAVEQDFEHPAHVLAGPLAELTPITHDNDALKPKVTARSVRWTNDGLEVQGWLLAPLAAPPAGARRPMVVVMHGGPGSAMTPSFGPAYPSGVAIPELIEHGYYVFMPNPRGSFGQGEAFTRANVRDFGGGDLRDILAGIDAVEKIAPVDDARLGVMGHSYGGYLTMWTVTHSGRFRAAVAGAGIANWLSYYGENGIDTWMTPFFGVSAYDDPAIYDRVSPIRAIKDARTPTLVYVGERDVEAPAPQSFEFWRGLKAMSVPASLVVYAGQGHAIRDLDALTDLRKRELDWFDTYLNR